MGVKPGGNKVFISGAGYIVRLEPGNKPGWYKLAAVFDEPPDGDELGWHKLADEFEEPPSSKIDS